MRVVRSFCVAIADSCAVRAFLRGRRTLRALERVLGISGRQKPAAPLLAAAGFAGSRRQREACAVSGRQHSTGSFQQHDIHLDHSQIEFAENNLRRAYAPFDPLLTSSFSDQRNEVADIDAAARRIDSRTIERSRRRSAIRKRFRQARIFRVRSSRTRIRRTARLIF